jgi:hypothetical protein
VVDVAALPPTRVSAVTHMHPSGSML